MCYVVAKNANKIGSVAIRMKLGKAVVQLKEEMNDQYLSKHIQFVTISRPSVWRICTVPFCGHDSGVQGGSREAVSPKSPNRKQPESAEIRAVSGVREVADSAPQGRKGKGKRRRKGVKTMSCRAQRAMRRVR